MVSCSIFLLFIGLVYDEIICYRHQEIAARDSCLLPPPLTLHCLDRDSKGQTVRVLIPELNFK